MLCLIPLTRLILPLFIGFVGLSLLVLARVLTTLLIAFLFRGPILTGRGFLLLIHARFLLEVDVMCTLTT